MDLKYTLRQLENFRAVADRGSIVRAADQLGISASAVTSSLNELERIWGVPLTVRRKSHGVTLTPSGERAIVEVRNLLNQAEAVQSSIGAGGNRLSGRIKIGSYVSLAPTLLVDLMSAFRAEHPGVELDFVADSQDLICQEVLDGRLDAAITYDLALPPGLDTMFLHPLTPMAVLPPGHPLSGGSSVSLAHLATEPMVLLDISPSRENTMLIFRDAGLQPRVDFRTTDFEVTRSLVARGLGYAILVQRPAGDLSYGGQPLAVRPLVPAPAPLPVIIVTNPRLRPSQPAVALLELAQRLLATQNR